MKVGRKVKKLKMKMENFLVPKVLLEIHIPTDKIISK